MWSAVCKQCLRKSRCYLEFPFLFSSGPTIDILSRKNKDQGFLIHTIAGTINFLFLFSSGPTIDILSRKNKDQGFLMHTIAGTIRGLVFTEPYN